MVEDTIKQINKQTTQTNRQINKKKLNYIYTKFTNVLARFFPQISRNVKSKQCRQYLTWSILIVFK